MQVNFLGPIRLTLALLPQMIERGGGRLVNLSSVAATLSSPGEAADDVSKAALSVFSEAMAIDLWDDGVKVLVVYPGVVDTPLFTQPDNDPFTAPVEFITVGELVQETFAALDRDALEVYIPAYFKDYVTGKANNVEGFVSGTVEYMRQQRAPTPSDDPTSARSDHRRRDPHRGSRWSPPTTGTRPTSCSRTFGCASPTRRSCSRTNPGAPVDREVEALLVPPGRLEAIEASCRSRRARCARGRCTTACARRCCSASRCRRSSA